MKIILFINDLGTIEILIIIFIIILFFGPDKIPEIARNLGDAIRKLNELKDHIKKEIILHSKTKLNSYTTKKKSIKKTTNNIKNIEGTVKRL